MKPSSLSCGGDNRDGDDVSSIAVDDNDAKSDRYGDKDTYIHDHASHALKNTNIV